MLPVSTWHPPFIISNCFVNGILPSKLSSKEAMEFVDEEITTILENSRNIYDF